MKFVDVALNMENTYSETYPFILNKISAGFPSPALDYMQDAITLDDLLIDHPEATFFIRVSGDSMTDAHIPDKSILVFDRSRSAQHNDIVVVSINKSDYTCKRFLKTDKGVFLAPANSKYKTIQLTEDMHCELFGVVAKIIIDTKDI